MRINVLGIVSRSVQISIRVSCVHIHIGLHRERKRQKREQENFKAMPENGDNLITVLCHYLELLW